MPLSRARSEFNPSKFARLVYACGVVLVLASLACGGGGGGGGGPTTPPPPAPPPPGPVSGNLQASVVGFENPGTSFAGSEVELVGVGTTVINNDNEFGFDNVPEGVQRLRITGTNHLARKVQVNVVGGGISRFDGIDLVEPGPFDLSAFDEIYRSFSIPGTIRWNERPRRVVLDQSLGSLPQGFSFFERQVKKAYNNWLPKNTDDFFAGTPVQSGSIDPIDPESFDCGDVDDGDIVIVGIDECPMEEEFIILGTTTHCFSTVQNEVVLAAIFFNPCTTETTIDHEIIHSLCAGHLDSRPNDSIMGPFGGPDEIQPIDRRHMRYTYSRPAGVLTPDDSWGLDVLQPNGQ